MLLIGNFRVIRDMYILKDQNWVCIAGVFSTCLTGQIGPKIELARNTGWIYPD